MWVRYNYEYDLESLSEFDVRVTADANRANAVNTRTAKPSPRTLHDTANWPNRTQDRRCGDATIWFEFNKRSSALHNYSLPLAWAPAPGNTEPARKHTEKHLGRWTLTSSVCTGECGSSECRWTREYRSPVEWTHSAHSSQPRHTAMAALPACVTTETARGGNNHLNIR